MQPTIETLPILRQDLKLMEASPSEKGSKNWLIFDPLQNKYFTIGLQAFNLLSIWENSCDKDKFLQKLKVNQIDIDENSLLVFIEFLKKNKLIKVNSSQDIKTLYEEDKNSKMSFFKWLLKNYLFIRIPLFKTDKFLENNLKNVNFLYSKIYKNIVLFLGFIGLVLVFRNYEQFINTFSYLFSTQGFIYYILALVFVKVLHEFGHAFTAKRNGVKVPNMGIAFLVLFPVMYTHTTDSWKLKSKYKRLQIVLAGVKVELYLAAVAIFLWNFLPEGILKTIAFIIATTSLFSSILINISPFLRFDGYYALSDWSDSKNLQPRSFAMARWFLRRYILGSNETVPEYLPRYKQNFFIIYAIATWIYRFFLFLGIALIVYFFAFKVLGIFLFIVEIVWFILLPIYKELKIWFSKFEEISLNIRNFISITVLLTLIALLFIPWNSKVKMPAVLKAEQINQIHVPSKTKIKKLYIKDGQFVNKGDILISFDSSENSFELKKVNQQISTIKEDLKRVAGVRELLNNRLVLEENLLKLEEKKEGLLALKNSFIIKAPFDGIVYKNDNFMQGQWVNEKEAILTLYNPHSLKIFAYSSQEDIKYLEENKKAKFISNSLGQALESKLEKISNLSLPSIEYPELTSVFGGSIAVTKDNAGNLLSQKAYYKVEARLINNTKEFNTRELGVLVVDSKPQSIIEKVYIQVASVLIRESGF